LNDERVSAEEAELKRLDRQQWSPGRNDLPEPKCTQELGLQNQDPAEAHDQRCVHDR
jgi:hypothetical protein